MVDLELPPHPDPDPDTAGFWESTETGHLAIARCQECGRWVHPPTERCAACAGPMGFERVSGRGVVFSRISVHQPTVPGYLRDLPYDVVLVELVEQQGLRLPARVETSPTSPRIGDPVELRLDPLPGSTYRIPVAVLADPTP